MSAAERAQRRLQQIAEGLEPALERALLAWAATATVDRLAEVVARLEVGDLDGVVALLFDHPAAVAAATAVRATWAAGLLRAVSATTQDLNRSQVLPSGRFVVAAPVASPETIAAVRRFEDLAFSRLVTDVRAGLRETVARELARGIGPREVAVSLKGTIRTGGLTAYDAKIIASFRETLESGRGAKALGRTLRDRRFDGSLRRLREKPLTPEQIDKMVAAYRRKLVAFRAQSFARTAAMQAANEAQAISWAEAVRQGAIPADEVRRFWTVAQDERLCKVCAPIPSLNPNGVRLDEPFTTPNGPVLHPPIHVACRCSTWTQRVSPLLRRSA